MMKMIDTMNTGDLNIILDKVRDLFNRAIILGSVDIRLLLREDESTVTYNTGSKNLPNVVESISLKDGLFMTRVMYGDLGILPNDAVRFGDGDLPNLFLSAGSFYFDVEGVDTLSSVIFFVHQEKVLGGYDVLIRVMDSNFLNESVVDGMYTVDPLESMLSVDYDV